MALSQSAPQDRPGSGSSLKQAGAAALGGSGSQVFTTTLYEQMKAKGLFKNHFPNIPPAGKSINVPLNDSAQQDLTPEISFPLPATPVNERKFRRISHGPGEICVHHGLKDQLLPAEDFRYGIRGQKGASTEDTMKVLRQRGGFMDVTRVGGGIPYLSGDIQSSIEAWSQDSGTAKPRCRSCQGHTTSECQQCLVPKKKKLHSHDHVAWLVVGRFTTVMILLWISGGFIHIINSLLAVGGTPKDLNGNIHDQVRLLLPRKLSAQWPEPSRFFEVTKLQCNSSSVVISTPFNVHTAHRAVNGLGPLAQIGEFEMKAAWCRSGQSCRALEKHASGWRLRSLGEESLAWLDVPDSWQLLAAAPEQKGALLAAWDGERIVISGLENTRGAWQLHRKFAVHPNCSEEAAADETGSDGGQLRPKVQALYLDTSSGCQTLTLLRGATVEGWDLVAGSTLGCWKIRADSSEYAALCHDNSDLLLARHGPQGPILETATLPEPFAHCIVNPGHAETSASSALPDKVEHDLK